MHRTLALLIFVLSISACAPRRAPSFVASQLAKVRQKSLLISAHRGGREFGADNSIEAISGSTHAGIPLLEVDLRSAPDGLFFLFHDRHLKPGNFSGPAALIGRDIQSLSAFERSQIKQPGAVASPLLYFGEALDLVRGSESILQLDVKDESVERADRIFEATKSLDLTGQVIVQTESLEVAKHIRESLQPLAILFKCDSDECIDAALRLNPEVIQINDIDPCPKTKVVHERGALVLVKALDEAGDNPNTWNRLKACDVDIILTDHVTEMKKFLVN